MFLYRFYVILIEQKTTQDPITSTLTSTNVDIAMLLLVNQLFPLPLSLCNHCKANTTNRFLLDETTMQGKKQDILYFRETMVD